MPENPTPQQLTIHGSASAPFIYFDGVAAIGHLAGVIQIEVAANSLVPQGSGTATEIIAIAHLRFGPGGLAALKDAIQKIETMISPGEGKAN